MCRWMVPCNELGVFPCFQHNHDQVKALTEDGWIHVWWYTNITIYYIFQHLFRFLELCSQSMLKAEGPLFSQNMIFQNSARTERHLKVFVFLFFSPRPHVLLEVLFFFINWATFASGKIPVYFSSLKCLLKSLLMFSRWVIYTQPVKHPAFFFSFTVVNIVNVSMCYWLQTDFTVERQ